MTTLIIAEKPKVAEKIAAAIGRPQRKTDNKVAYFEVADADAIVAPSVGHVYSLSEKGSGGWSLTYPTFDIDWAPTYKSDKGAAFTKPYLDNIAELAKRCDRFINACDYDTEGSVIGYNILRYACGADPAKGKVKRMHFSTITLGDLKKAYASLEPFDAGQTNAGIARHVLDWYYGINLSRALNSAIKSAGVYSTLSIGRVQGPALKLLADREGEIAAFKPEPFWVISALLNKGADFEALHEKDKFWAKAEAEGAYGKCANAKSAKVLEVERKELRQPAPNPFDLTALQIEAYRHHRIDPKRTLELSQSLYEAGLISYPRTSSQQLPPAIGYKGIIENIAKQKKYKESAEALLKSGKLWPNNGKKEDPAHPALFATGEMPDRITVEEEKLYDLIVRRFLATFGQPAVRESVKAVLDAGGETFVAKGITTKEKNWHELYGQYAVFDEITLPAMKKGDTAAVKKINLDEKQTQPPKRYTQASIISELEKRNLGTKATRATIIDTLYKRGYITGKPIQVTHLGVAITETLARHVPQILDEQLTRNFEEEMEQITDGKIDKDKVTDGAKTVLAKISEKFKSDEKDIGNELREAIQKTKKEAGSLGECPKCGSSLVVRRNSATKKQFVGCSNYPNCTLTAPLPQSGAVKSAGRKCPKCGYPIVNVWTKGKKAPWSFCINVGCK